jgi:hypothetical protein
MKECDNSKIHTYKQQLHVVYLSSNYSGKRVVCEIMWKHIVQP